MKKSNGRIFRDREKMKTYLLKIFKYKEAVPKITVYKVTTDSIYRIIGKMYCSCSAIWKIDRIDYCRWSRKREEFWYKLGYKVRTYYEPTLSED